MKRFGGIEFLSAPTSNSYNLINATFIDQITNFINRINQSFSLVDTVKVASLFRITPSQVAVSIDLISPYFKSHLYKDLFLKAVNLISYILTRKFPVSLSF